jgi:hypothetical protein
MRILIIGRSGYSAGPFSLVLDGIKTIKRDHFLAQIEHA